MGELLGQQFVVENKTGAGGNIGAEAVAKASPDGYTILMATVSTNAINPGLYKHLSYDAMRDFAPLGRVGVTPTLFLVHPSIPATDVEEPSHFHQSQSRQVQLRFVRTLARSFICAARNSSHWRVISTSPTCRIKDPRRWTRT